MFMVEWLVKGMWFKGYNILKAKVDINVTCEKKLGYWFFKKQFVLGIKVTIPNLLVEIVLKDNLLVLRVHIMTMSHKRVG
jgi:hypothetical protein